MKVMLRIKSGSSIRVIYREKPVSQAPSMMRAASYCVYTVSSMLLMDVSRYVAGSFNKTVE